MAKPNYAFAKRQRDIAKKQKKDDRKKSKSEAKQLPDDGLMPEDELNIGAPDITPDENET